SRRTPAAPAMRSASVTPTRAMSGSTRDPPYDYVGYRYFPRIESTTIRSLEVPSMRISELSQASGVPVATIKYYLREGLLHEGQLTSATQAQYDQSHLARLRLVRALLGAGGLSVAAARDVLDRLAQPPASMHDLLGEVQRLLGPR